MKQLCVIVLLVLVGCIGYEHHRYEGESPHWEAIYTVNAGNKMNSEKLLLAYKGDLEELANVERIEYSYEANSSEGKTVRTFTDGPPQQKVFINRSSSTGGYIHDQTIKVTITWGDQTEVLELEKP